MAEATGTAAVAPTSMPYNADATLTAQTTAGADCTATVVYNTDRSPVSFSGVNQTADASGQVTWPWHEETEGDGGTATVSCNLNGQTSTTQTSFTVIQ